MKLHDFRQNYTKGRLLGIEMEENPFEFFQFWFKEAIDSGISEPNAMALSTCDKMGNISSRIVLLKEMDAGGFVFYTNYDSTKGRQLIEHPQAALLFWWQSLERQVKIHGRVEKVSAAESDSYFNSRPFESRVGASVSAQSQPIPDDNYLERAFAEALSQHLPDTITRPSHWGGFRVIPDKFEFWQGRPNRIHDRFQYILSEAGTWQIDRLSP